MFRLLLVASPGTPLKIHTVSLGVAVYKPRTVSPQKGTRLLIRACSMLDQLREPLTARRQGAGLGFGDGDETPGGRDGEGRGLE